MPHQTDRLTCKSLIFHHAVVFLLLTHSHEGRCQGNGQSSEIIWALLGENIILPCHVSPATDAVNTMLEWARPDLQPRFVHVRRDGEDRLFDQQPSYQGRTSVSIDGLRRGDMSLKLSKVKFSDEGTYRCYIPGFGTETSVELVVDVFIEITNVSRGVLQCESKGWYPEPEMFWLDAEGSLLSAGPTETVRGPDDLYTVSSRVTVEKRHGNSFTCRVQQNHTNQIRETLIHVPDDFFKDPPNSGSSAAAIISALAGVALVLAVCFAAWKRKQKRNNSKTIRVDEETTGESDASEQKPLMKAAEGEQLENQSKVEEGINSKSEQIGLSGQTEEEKQPEQFRTEAEANDILIQTQSENVETGSQCVTENERQQHEVQTTEDLVNREKETESVSEGSSDQAERDTLSEKPEKSEDTGDQEEETKSETAGQGLMKGGGQPLVGAGGEAETDPHKEENKEQIQTKSAGQSPADGGRQGKHPSAGEGTNPDLEEKGKDTKAGDVDGGDKTTSIKENTTPQSPVDGQTGQLKDTDGQNTLDHNDEHKEAETSTNNATAGQGQTAGETSETSPSANQETNTGQQTGKESEKSPESRDGDKAGVETKSDKDTDSVSNKTETPSSVETETNTGQKTDKEQKKSPESRDGDKKKTPGSNATTPDQTSAEDGKIGVEKEEDDNSQIVNDPNN